MKTIIILIVAFLFTANIAYSSTDYKDLTVEQIDVMKVAYLKGLPYNLGYTMSAIVWQESNAGKININISDPSAGITHIKISTAIHYLGLRNTPYIRNSVAQYLIDNPNMAMEIAIHELQYWKRYWHGSWKKAVSSYNGGFKGNPKYEKNIVHKIRILRKYLWK